MKKFGLTLFTGAIVFTLVFHFCADTAKSRPQYRVEFLKLYVKPDSSEETEKAFAAVVKDANCNVCHVGGPMERRNRNVYGKELAKILKPEGGKGNERDAKVIDEAMTKVADVKVDPKDPKSPTFGDLIKQGKLPGGDPKQPVAEEKK